MRAAARLLFCSLCAAVALGAAEPGPDDLVRVSGHVITRAELERFMDLSGPQFRAAGSEAAVPAEYAQVQQQLEREALHALVEWHLLLQEARARYTGNEGADRALERFADQELRKLEAKLGSQLKVQRMLLDAGLSVREYMDMQRDALLVALLERDEVRPKAEVSPAEIRAYYEAHAGEFRRPRCVVYWQALFPVVDQAPEDVRAGAEAFRRQVLDGAEFADLAARQSGEGAGPRVGRHETEVPASAPDWMPKAVEGLAPGQVSEVRAGAGGWTVARLEAMRPAGVVPFDEAQEGIRTRLAAEKALAARRALVERLRRGAVIEVLPAGEELMR